MQFVSNKGHEFGNLGAPWNFSNFQAQLKERRAWSQGKNLFSIQFIPRWQEA